MPKTTVDVYVDGSYKNGIYAYGYAIFKNDQLIHQDCGQGTNSLAASMNNVAGELSGVMRAASWLKQNGMVATIHYDYQGIEAWATNKWKTKNEHTKKYAQFIKPFVDCGIITFNKVKGHSGNKGNDLADQLAKSALGIGGIL